MTEGLAPTPAERDVDALGDRLWWLAPVGAGLLAAALAEVRATRASLGAEEASTVQIARSSLATIWHTARADDVTHLTTHLLWKPWLAVAGTTEDAVRAPSVLFAALAAALTVLVGRELAGWLAGTVAGLLLATNAFVLDAAVTADGRALTLLLVVASAYALVRAVESDQARWWVAYAVGALATASVDLAAVAVLPAHVAYLVLRRPAGWMRAAGAFGVVAVATAAHVALASRSHAWTLDWLEEPGLRTIGSGLWEACGRNPVAIAAAVAGLVAVAAGWTRARPGPGVALLGGWLVAPALAILAVSAWRPAFAAAYLVASTPALALLAGAAVGAETRVRVAAGAVAVTALALAVGSTVSVAHFLREHDRADWRAATRFVTQHRGGSTVLVSPAADAPIVAYYAPTVRVAAAPAGRAVWVVASAADAHGLVAAGRAAVGAPAYALLEERSFGETLTVQRWVRP